MISSWSERCSKDKVVEISKATRDLDKIVSCPFINELLNITEIKQSIAAHILEKDSHRKLKDTKALVIAIQENYEGFEDGTTFYDYDSINDRIVEKEINLKEKFIEELSKLTSSSVAHANTIARQLHSAKKASCKRGSLQESVK